MAKSRELIAKIVRQSLDKLSIRARITDEKRVLAVKSNPLHVFEQNLLSPAIVKLSRPAVGVAGDPLGGFKSAVIFQKIRDAGRPK
jgi:hypothetical protein